MCYNYTPKERLYHTEEVVCVFSQVVKILTSKYLGNIVAGYNCI